MQQAVRLTQDSCHLSLLWRQVPFCKRRVQSVVAGVPACLADLSGVRTHTHVSIKVRAKSITNRRSEITPADGHALRRAPRYARVTVSEGDPHPERASQTRPDLVRNPRPEHRTPASLAPRRGGGAQLKALP